LRVERAVLRARIIVFNQGSARSGDLIVMTFEVSQRARLDSLAGATSNAKRGETQEIKFLGLSLVLRLSSRALLLSA